ncbi:nicotinamide-nucleotide amidohydrolase family protein [Chryseobacterium sp. GMJ5]|uniref:Nicotinamide-nucleotide amidohydrolase family protein n=1 Tax=Chryseobacterium gilvum TaxID=2976534 RepID=A0ABT2VYC7_9FLAO|nr:nicotinamide-nucleotide amidohydrolase family protein [Chryseobacterium gilvum]MCU7613490.1 nicotinamide-nucleotide amidohydrolase family protein [Chryseobacterium gilvum]
MEFQENVLKFISESLINAGETVSMAESVTSGFLQFSFSQMKDASQFFKGGITVYTLDEKVNLLRIDQEKAERCNCVSMEIAEDLALNIARLFKTDWSIGVTGYATPVEESDYQIFAYFAFSYKNEIIFSKKMSLHPRTKAVNAQMYYSEFILGCYQGEIDRLLSSE